MANCGCGGTGWVTQISEVGIGMAPCRCKGGPIVLRQQDFAWFLHTATPGAADGLNRLVLGTLKDGTHVIGAPFEPPEMAALMHGPQRSPVELALYVLASEVSRLRACITALEKKLDAR